MQLSDLQLFLGLQIPEDCPSPLNHPAASAPLRRKAPVHIREWLSDLVVCCLSEHLLHRPPRLVLHSLKQHHHALHGIHALKETVSSKSRFDNTAIDWKQLLWFPMMFGCLLVPIDFELQLMNPDPVVSWDRFFVSDTIAAFCYVAPTILGVISLFFDSVSRELFESLSAGCTVIGIVASINFLKLKGLYAILMHIPLTFYAFYGPYLLYSHQKAKQN